MAVDKNPPPTAKATGADKTVIKALGLSGGIFGACPSAVDVKDGRVVRIRPLHWDSEYDQIGRASCRERVFDKV
jgi:hypothetical protein